MIRAGCARTASSDSGRLGCGTPSDRARCSPPAVRAPAAQASCTEHDAVHRANESRRRRRALASLHPQVEIAIVPSRGAISRCLVPNHLPCRMARTPNRARAARAWRAPLRWQTFWPTSGSPCRTPRSPPKTIAGFLKLLLAEL